MKAKYIYFFCALLIFTGCQKKNLVSSDEALQTIIQNNDAETGRVNSGVSLDKIEPIYQYYKKIPHMTGVTNDPENLIFKLQIELGYDVGNVRTLEKLSRQNVKIAGEVRQSMAAKTKVYLGNQKNYKEIEKDILELVNKIIAPNQSDKARVKDVIITELLLHDYR